MSFSAVKRVALTSVARGIRMPENPVSRYYELLHLKPLLWGFQLFDLSVVARGRGDELLELNCFMRREEPVLGAGRPGRSPRASGG